MATFSDLVDEVKSKIAGYTLNQDRMTYVKNATGITSSDTAILVGSSDNYTKGIIEIDDELMYVDNFNTTTTTLNITPGFGRGFRGTTAASHAVYAPIIFTPAFPRVTVKNAINDTISSLFPKLFAVKKTTLVYNPIVATYALPTDCQDVISISWRVIGSSKYWQLARRFRVDMMSNQAEFATPSTVAIFDRNIPSGATIQVTYTALPKTMSANTDVFTTTTGLPESCREIVVLGAASRMLAFIDAGRINVTSAESDLADSKIPTSAGQTLGKFVYALYQQRLQEESAKMLAQYPASMHYIN